jgi:hypothetical protein
MEWKEAKRAMGSADKLFAAMRGLDRTGVPTKRVVALIDLFQNPCLSQDVLRPVSGAVARIAEWVHAYAVSAALERDVSVPTGAAEGRR